MDPDKCLEEALKNLDTLANSDTTWDAADARTAAVNRLQALAVWLENGGFSPIVELWTNDGEPMYWLTKNAVGPLEAVAAAVNQAREMLENMLGESPTNALPAPEDND